MKEWLEIKKSENKKTVLWQYSKNEDTHFEIWMNKACVSKIETTLVDEALLKFDEFVNHITNDNMTLNEYLKLTNTTLTKLEIDSLECIFGEGSFFEESAQYDEEKKMCVAERNGTFFGWEIFEDEVTGCRGALASLVKKGIITIAYDDSFGDGPQAMYFIHFTPEFLPAGHGYHALDINKDFVKEVK